MLLYAATAAAMISLPGPDVLLVSSRSLTSGVRAGLRVMAGSVSGYLLITVLVASGVGALAADEPAVLEVLRVAAVLYLLWLAVRSWRSEPTPAVAAASPIRRGWTDGFLTAALNPKGLLFFLALLPPFVDPDRPATRQLLVLGGVFCLLSALIYGVIALGAARLGARVDGSSTRAGRTVAVVLVGAAVLVGAGPV